MLYVCAAKVNGDRAGISLPESLYGMGMADAK